MAWELTGNPNTNPNTNFLGTTAEANPKPLVIKTNGAEALRIDSAGNVGVGTPKPNAKLEVDGSGPLVIIGTPGASANTEILNIHSGIPRQDAAIRLDGSDNINQGYIHYNASGQYLALAVGSSTAGKYPDNLVVKNGGNVGIGTPSPTQMLQLSKPGNTTNLISFGDDEWHVGNTNTTDFKIYRARSAQLYITSAGSVDIGVYDGNVPYAKLTVTGSDATVNVETTEILRVMRPAVSGVKNHNSAGFFVGAFEPGINGRSQLDIKVAGTPGNSNTWGSVPDITVMTLQSNGSVGIGTTNPGALLEIASPSNYGVIPKLRLTDNYSGGKTWEIQSGIQGISDAYFGIKNITDNLQALTITDDGSVQIAGDLILTNADCAEEFDIAETAEIEPGTVVVLDQDGVLHQSHQAYDKRVAGVISGAGDYKPGLILDRRQSQDHRVPVALVGKVYCKVDAQYAPIEVGDLLTTSPTPGHAMKADDALKAFGSVIGKALRPLETGQGLVPILIALQ